LQTPAGAYRWNIRLDTGLRPDLTIAVRMEAGNQKPLDYYLFPSFEIEHSKMRLSENNGLALDVFRYENLDIFFQLSERAQIKEAS